MHASRAAGVVLLVYATREASITIQSIAGVIEQVGADALLIGRRPVLIAWLVVNVLLPLVCGVGLWRRERWAIPASIGFVSLAVLANMFFERLAR